MDDITNSQAVFDELREAFEQAIDQAIVIEATGQERVDEIKIVMDHGPEGAPMRFTLTVDLHPDTEDEEGLRDIAPQEDETDANAN